MRHAKTRVTYRQLLLEKLRTLRVPPVGSTVGSAVQRLRHRLRTLPRYGSKLENRNDVFMITFVGGTAVFIVAVLAVIAVIF